jgi:hypothetical protein
MGFRYGGDCVRSGCSGDCGSRLVIHNSDVGGSLMGCSGNGVSRSSSDGMS